MTDTSVDNLSTLGKKGGKKMKEHCFDCKYSSSVNHMQSCTWKSGLASAYQKCEKYERDWGKTLIPSVFIGVFLILIIRIIILGIWRILNG